MLDNDRARLKLINSLLFTLPGSPTLYYGDEIGMGDDIWLPDRDGVRTPMQWQDAPNAGFSSADPQKLYTPVIRRPEYYPAAVNVTRQLADPDSLLNCIRRMIAIRKQNPVLGWGDFEWLESDCESVAAYRRASGESQVISLNNLSPETQIVRVKLPPSAPPTWKTSSAAPAWPYRPMASCNSS